jgi:AcrR family transcriptional regulator
MRGRPTSIDAAVMTLTADEPADGRHRRSMSSQRRIVQAMLELVAEGNVAPSADEVSDRAGVGRRSVFRHFSDMDSLYREMAAVLHVRFAQIAEQPFKAAQWRDQLIELVERRANAFDRMAPYLNASIVHRNQSPVLREGHARFVGILRARLVNRLPPDVARDKVFVDAVDLLISFEAWQRLREDQGLSPSEAKQVLCSAVQALLAQRDRARGKS